MTTVPFDALALTAKLKTAGFSAEQAEAVVRVIAESQVTDYRWRLGLLSYIAFGVIIGVSRAYQSGGKAQAAQNGGVGSALTQRPPT
jgi:hypothetical protein